MITILTYLHSPFWLPRYTVECNYNYNNLTLWQIFPHPSRGWAKIYHIFLYTFELIPLYNGLWDPFWLSRRTRRPLYNWECRPPQATSGRAWSNWARDRKWGRGSTDRHRWRWRNQRSSLNLCGRLQISAIFNLDGTYYHHGATLYFSNSIQISPANLTIYGLPK